MGKLNGTHSNGQDVDVPVALPLYDHMQEAEGGWPRADDVWPDATLDDYELEHQRLEAEIAAAKARAAVARHRAALRDAQVREALRGELEASQERLALMEREHETAVAAVLADAKAEAARILAGAREQLSAPSVSSSVPEQVTCAE